MYHEPKVEARLSVNLVPAFSMFLREQGYQVVHRPTSPHCLKWQKPSGSRDFANALKPRGGSRKLLDVTGPAAHRVKEFLDAYEAGQYRGLCDRNPVGQMAITETSFPGTDMQIAIDDRRHLDNASALLIRLPPNELRRFAQAISFADLRADIAGGIGDAVTIKPTRIGMYKVVPVDTNMGRGGAIRIPLTRLGCKTLPDNIPPATILTPGSQYTISPQTGEMKLFKLPDAFASLQDSNPAFSTAAPDMDFGDLRHGSTASDFANAPQPDLTPAKPPEPKPAAESPATPVGREINDWSQLATAISMVNEIRRTLPFTVKLTVDPKGELHATADLVLEV